MGFSSRTCVPAFIAAAAITPATLGSCSQAYFGGIQPDERRELVIINMRLTVRTRCSHCYSYIRVGSECYWEDPNQIGLINLHAVFCGYPLYGV